MPNRAFAEALLPMLFPELSKCAEESPRFHRPVRTRVFLNEIGITSDAEPISPRTVMHQALGLMSLLYGVPCPSYEALETAMLADQYLRVENLDSEIEIGRYRDALKSAGLYQEERLPPETIIEVLVRKVIPPLLGTYV